METFTFQVITGVGTLVGVFATAYSIWATKALDQGRTTILSARTRIGELEREAQQKSFLLSDPDSLDLLMMIKLGGRIVIDTQVSVRDVTVQVLNQTLNGCYPKNDFFDFVDYYLPYKDGWLCFSPKDISFRAEILGLGENITPPVKFVFLEHLHRVVLGGNGVVPLLDEVREQINQCSQSRLYAISRLDFVWDNKYVTMIDPAIIEELKESNLVREVDIHSLSNIISSILRICLFI